MLRTSFSILLAVSFALAACADVGDAPEAETTAIEPIELATETTFSGTPFPLNTENSSIEWTAAKITRTHDGGFGAFSGSIYVDRDVISGVEITIDAASIFSDEDRLTNHLKSGDFFDVEAHPEARFEATSFEPIADGSGEFGATHTVTGTLTLRDQTNQIVFPATLAVDSEMISASADFIIDRQLWGLTYPGQPDDLIRDQIRIKLTMNADRGAVKEAEEAVETSQAAYDGARY